MNQTIFQSSSIPVLEQMVNFAQARHTVLAGNIANLDTPGYKVRDLSVEDFQSRMKAAIENRHRSQVARSPGHMVSQSDTSLAEVSKNPKNILYHDESNVSVEHQVSEMVKNQMQHNLALTIMTSQFRLLETAISERL